MQQRLLLLSLVLSGAAALIYQTVWIRLLALSFGTTLEAMGTVFAVFFLGLALGAVLAKRLMHEALLLRRYTIIELVIAVSGLLLLPILLNLHTLLLPVATLQEGVANVFTVTFLLLAVPTVCMGATFPLLAAYLIRNSHTFAQRLGSLYAWNTFGAVVGLMVGTFVFIPLVGLDGAVAVAALFNLLAATGAFFVYRYPGGSLEKAVTHASADADASDSERMIAGVVLFVTGFTALGSEIGWIRYFSIVTETSLYSYAVTLALILASLALGSWFFRVYARKFGTSMQGMGMLLILGGTALLATRLMLWGYPTLLGMVDSGHEWNRPGLWQHYALIAVAVVPPMVIYGFLFPISTSLFCRGDRREVGTAYAINTLAAIVASLSASFWLIPREGTDFLLLLMALLMLGSALVILLRQSGRFQLHRLFLVGCLGTVAVLLPAADFKMWIASVKYRYDYDAIEGKKPEFLFIKEGRSGVVSMVRYNGPGVKLKHNHLNESYFELDKPAKMLLSESLLGFLPYLLKGEINTMYMVGFGGGVTLQAAAMTPVKQISVVELEPVVLEANLAVRRTLMECLLDDERIEVEIADARHRLSVDQERYDAIVSQPSHPWLSGASHLFTREFFSLVEKRMTDEGVYAQWVNLFRMDVTTLRSVMKAFYDVFPHGYCLVNKGSGDMILVGAKTPLSVTKEVMQRRMAAPGVKEVLAMNGVRSVEQLLDYFWFDADLTRRSGWESWETNTDTTILTEVRLYGLSEEPKDDENVYLFLKKLKNEWETRQSEGALL